MTHSPYAYSYVLIPCLPIDYKAPIVLLQIPYKACFFPPFLFEILYFPHVYKAPGAQRSPGGIPDNQIRPLKPDDRPETTKEYVGWETEKEDVLTENEGDWGSRDGMYQEVSGSWERGWPLSRV